MLWVQTMLALVCALPLLYAMVIPLRHIFENTPWNIIPKHSWTSQIPSPFCLHCGKSAGNSQDHFFHLRPFLMFTGKTNSTANSYRFFQKIQVISSTKPSYWNPQGFHWTRMPFKRKKMFLDHKNKYLFF